MSTLIDQTTTNDAEKAQQRTIIVIASSETELQLTKKLAQTYQLHGANSSEEASIVLSQFPDAYVIIEQGMLCDIVRPKLMDGGYNAILLSQSPTFNDGVQALQQGFKGYGNLHSHTERLIAAIQLIQAGEVWLGASIVEGLKKSILPRSKKMIEQLTPKEREVAKQVVQELNNKEVAQQLEMSERTVKAHLSMIYEKLSVKNRTELIFHYKNEF